MKPQPKLKTRSIADVSTGHVQLQDTWQLVWAAEQYRLGKETNPVWNYGEGFLVYCSNNDEHHLHNLQTKYRFSDAFRSLLQCAGCQDFTYLQLDADAEVYDDLEKFDWDEAGYGQFFQDCEQKGLGALSSQTWITQAMQDTTLLGVAHVKVTAWAGHNHFSIVDFEACSDLSTPVQSNPETEARMLKALHFIVHATLGKNYFDVPVQLQLLLYPVCQFTEGWYSSVTIDAPNNLRVQVSVTNGLTSNVVYPFLRMRHPRRTCD